MIAVSLSIGALFLLAYYLIIHPRIEKAAGKKIRGWDSLDEELPHITAWSVAFCVVNFLTTAACYYFDFGIEASADDVRHSLYVIFSFGLGISFFGFFLPRVLHFSYNDFTFSKPLSGWGALLLIVATFVALRPLMKYVAELIAKALENIWGFLV